MTEAVPTEITTADLHSHSWWQRAAVYQIYPRSFRDGNGDGLGDLRGVIEGLPYLASLGVDALWLSPFYPSPQKDAGYDVSDPRAVDPMFGTIEDFAELVEQAHERGLRVIVDIVPNHVSASHPWFLEALDAEPDSPERCRFHFLDGRGENGEIPPNNWESIFGGAAWTRVKEPDGSWGQWYLHLFDSTQPDLNWEDEEVRADALNTLKFWLDLGVDGFRVDVALGLAKDMTYPDLIDPIGMSQSLRFDLDPSSQEAIDRRAGLANSALFDRDEVQDIYREWRSLLNSYGSDKMAVVEAWVSPHRASRYVSQDTLHQIFGFDFLVVPWEATAMRSVIERAIEAVALVGAPPTWALSNHDSPRVVTRLGDGREGLARARSLALVAHALPGSVYVYQGEELGLSDVHIPDSARQDPVWFRSAGQQKGRDGGRVPLPWFGTEPPYGFTERFDVELWLPQPEGWAKSTIEAEDIDPFSTLNLYRTSLALRHSHPGLSSGEFCFLDTDNPGVLAFGRGADVVVIANTSGEWITSPAVGLVLLASGPIETGHDGLRIGPDTTVWLQT
ncbi:MAG TPA: glycoside hydrolase family 13 protein [Candidatus Nanopelagicales bacterium]|nr:glycoside hydrolase family 13 protein [Candidatus Nanopelagicales bacterium]